jgi:hypothetical protein
MPMTTHAAAANVAIAPVARQVTVNLAQADAFELFTGGLSRWWPLATHSCAGAAALRVDVEPRVGGQVIEKAHDGSTALWGTVLVWEPPARFAMTWHPGSAAERSTRVDVEFRALDAQRCQVDLVHSGWEARGDEAATVRGRYDGGWVSVLERYVQASADLARDARR